MGKRIFRPPFKVGYNGGAGQCFYVYDASGARVSTEFRPSSADADELARILNAGVAALTKPAALPNSEAERRHEELHRAYTDAGREPPALPKEGEELIIETLARLEEVHGNKAGAFTLRNVGILGTVFEQRAAVLRDALSSLPVRSGEVGAAMAKCTGIESGPNGRGEMRVVAHFPVGEETALFSLLNAALAIPQQVKEGGRHG